MTGPQIYKNAGDAIDAIVIGVGSGGTITGVAEYIKAWNSMVRIVAVEPAECAAISGGFIGQHGISGIGPGFVPENYNPYVVDTVLTVTTADAERAAREVLFFDGVPAWHQRRGDARRRRAAAEHGQGQTPPVRLCRAAYLRINL